MNLLYTTAGKFDSQWIARNLGIWRSLHHIVEYVPGVELNSYLRFHQRSSRALIDAIVCSADGTHMYTKPNGGIGINYGLDHAMHLSWDVRSLPENHAMLDGRKWRSVPFVIFRSVFDHDLAAYAQKETHAKIEFAYHGDPYFMLYFIKNNIEAYRAKVLDGYVSCGLMVRLENGKAQVDNALRLKNPELESEHYASSKDKRRSGWVTFSRDQQGIRGDIAEFENLINSGATERRMHRFFELNPAFLMDARLGVPLSHAPVLLQPKGWIPDFVVSPILGPRDDQMEILELKGPAEQLLTRGVHGGFTAKVKSAIDQIKDYKRWLSNAQNKTVTLDSLGCLPSSPRLAVLIGRLPSTDRAVKLRERRQEEIDVKVITYDEILTVQENQVEII